MDMHRLELLSIGDRGHLTYTRLERGLEAFLVVLAALLWKVSVMIGPSI